ncbi:histone H2A.Z-specific chaperone CHZ1-like [Cynara cardunculus var. scolymus]|uniref:histone H2A.Z-specific chaperone CHZ1-like n=1 Tax=Cynara cardunculus var. scolymus TaxID=59895 RepID=UPI000D62C070|nr:histone H2A.Z-specific chaperone CHZ1-like [Cynara cardunculus var. scolymus]
MTSVNPSDDVENPSGFSRNKPTTIETEAEGMAEDVKLGIPVVATVLDEMDKVHKAMLFKGELINGLSAVKYEVCDVKECSDPYPEDAIDEDDSVITSADHEDHLSTSALPIAGDEDDDEDDDEEENVELQIPDASNDLGDDDEDDEFCIQVIPRHPTLKGISIWEPSS